MRRKELKQGIKNRERKEKEKKEGKKEKRKRKVGDWKDCEENAGFYVLESSTFPKIQQNFRSRKIKAGLPKPNSKCRIVNVAKPKLCNKTLHNKTLRNKVLHSTTLQIKASQIKASHD